MKHLKVKTLLLAFFLVMGVTTLSMAQTITWRMASAWPGGTQIQWAADYFAETVQALSGGRMEIRSYPAGTMVGALEVFDAVRMGTIEIAHASPAYWIGRMPAGALFGYLPFGMEAIPYLTWMYEDEGLTLYHELYKPFGFGFVMPCGIIPPEILAWSNKPIESIDDFKGLKFRTSGYWGEILTEAGASVVMLPAGQIYEALQRRVIDAAEFSIPSMDKTLAFHEIAKYLLVPGIHQPSTILDVMISQKAWASLPDDLKEIVKGAAQMTTLRMLTNSIKKDAEAYEFFRAQGITINYLSPSIQKELYDRSLKLMEKKAAADPFIARVWESQQRFRKQYEEYNALSTLQYE